MKRDDIHLLTPGTRILFKDFWRDVSLPQRYVERFSNTEVTVKSVGDAPYAPYCFRIIEDGGRYAFSINRVERIVSTLPDPASKDEILSLLFE